MDRKIEIHHKMLEKSFHRDSDGMTSILLGYAVSISDKLMKELEKELRAEFQQKISEINLEYDSRTCENCMFNAVCEIQELVVTQKYEDCENFGCSGFDRK